jgi:hypothetical protein
MNGSKFDANIGKIWKNIGKIWKNIGRRMILFFYCELRQLSGEPAPYDGAAPAALPVLFLYSCSCLIR